MGSWPRAGTCRHGSTWAEQEKHSLCLICLLYCECSTLECVHSAVAVPAAFLWRCGSPPLPTLNPLFPLVSFHLCGCLLWSSSLAEGLCWCYFDGLSCSYFDSLYIDLPFNTQRTILFPIYSGLRVVHQHWSSYHKLFIYLVILSWQNVKFKVIYKIGMKCHNSLWYLILLAPSYRSSKISLENYYLTFKARLKLLGFGFS